MSVVPRSVWLACSLLLALAAPVAATSGPVTVFLDPRGGVIEGGIDDAAAGTSLIASNGPGGRAKVPAWSGGKASWTRIVRCVRGHFADFQVDIVDTPPGGTDYIRIMVGGRPGIVGAAEPITGLAPFDGHVLRGAVGFVFSAALGNRPTVTCEAIAHEVGHTLGLEHAIACNDLMSYQRCGPKRFRVEASPCGELEERPCENGEETQSSYHTLVATVGLRNAPSAPAPEREPGVQVELALDREVLPGNQWITITVRARANAGLADVVLAWASDDAQYLISCASPPEEGPITCQPDRDGTRFHFRVHAGVGRRAIAALAIDASGHQAVTEPRMIFLDER